MRRKVVISVNDRFDRLTVRKRGPMDGKYATWVCLCVCRNVVTVWQGNLRSGNTRSCGCAATKHGHSKVGRRTPEYTAWQNMNARCRNDRNYVGRITICARWKTFANFLSDMGLRSSSRHTVERKDNNGHYTPRNCVWATRKQQQNNRRVCRRIKIDGVRLTLTQWSERGGVHKNTLRKRLAAGVPPKTAVFTPAGGL